MQWIDNARQWWRMLSVQAMAIAAALQAAWVAVPEEIRGTLPPYLLQWVSMGLLLGGILGRLVRQPGVTPPAPPAEPEVAYDAADTRPMERA